MMDALTSGKAVDKATERFKDFERERQPHEDGWRQIAEYVLPRANFDIQYGPQRPRKRHLVDTTAVVANERLAALTFGYLIPPSGPWVRPVSNAEQESYLASRYFDDAQRQMYNHFKSPQSNFVAAVDEAMLHCGAFGNGVVWIGKRPGYPRPVHKALPLFECYWRHNAYDQTDTMVRKFWLPLAVAAMRYQTEKLTEKAQKPNADPFEPMWFYQWTEPREGGVVGARPTSKPFSNTVFCETTREVINEGGFDEFPYAVARFRKRAGECYGEGPGLTALPLARLLNEMEETILRQAELSADPPLVSRIGQVKPLFRGPGGLTNLSASQLRMLEPNQRAFERLYDGGDVGVSIEMVRDIRFQINQIFYIDWMSMNAQQVLSATEVNFRRAQILRAMSPIVARMESELLTPIAERNFSAQQPLFRRPPAELDQQEVFWSFNSPLNQAQQQGVIESLDMAFGILERAATLKPDVLDIADMDAAVREALAAAGLRVKHLFDPSAIEQVRQRRAQQAEEQRQTELAQQQGAALRDAAQGVQSLEAANAA